MAWTVLARGAVTDLATCLQAAMAVSRFHSRAAVLQGAGAAAFKGFTSIIASALILWLSFALLKFMVRLSLPNARRCHGKMHARVLAALQRPRALAEWEYRTDPAWGCHRRAMRRSGSENWHQQQSRCAILSAYADCLSLTDLIPDGDVSVLEGLSAVD